MGRFDLTAGVVNGVVGAGIFGAPAAVAALVGPWGPLAALAAAAGILTVVLCFAEVGSRFDTSGGPYLYTHAAFGRQVISHQLDFRLSIGSNAQWVCSRDKRKCSDAHPIKMIARSAQQQLVSADFVTAINSERVRQQWVRAAVETIVAG
jgi:amino acid transporter